jgi:ABC-2 type transport system permease protein
MFRNRFLSLSFWGEAKTAFFSLIGLFFLAFIYLAAYRLIAYLNSVEMIGPLLVNKLIALVFLTSFSMVVFSALITSFNTIFLSKDLFWLMTTPLSIRKLLAFKTLSTSFYSSWMVMVALFPLLVALGQVKHAGLSFYPAAIMLLVPFFILASSTGVIVSILLMRIFPAKATRDVMLFLGIFAFCALYVLFRFIEPEKLVRPDRLIAITQYLSFLDSPVAAYLPSWWVTTAILSTISMNYSDLITYSSLLAGSCALVFSVLLWAGYKIYYIGWAEGQILAKSHKTVRHAYTRRSPTRALFDKDVTIFFRDAGQWSQLMILGSIVFVYLFSLYKLPLDTLYLQNLISFVNIGLIAFVLSAVALRLVFPLVSVEGDSVWLLFTVPLKKRKIFFEKFLFGAIPVFLMALVLVIFSNLILKADTTVFYLTSFATLAMSVGLTSMALGFGAIFPRFDMSNIAEIESSAGGIFYMVASLFYIVINLSFLAVPIHDYYLVKFHVGQSGHIGIILIAAVVVFNLFSVLVPLSLGLKNFENIEK